VVIFSRKEAIALDKEDFNKMLDDYIKELKESHPFKDDIGGKMNLQTEEIAANVCVNLLYRYHELVKIEG
jgi:hypothetical protein